MSSLTRFFLGETFDVSLFGEAIGIYKPADVRPILKAYAGKNVPLEYAKKEAEAKQKHIEEWRNNKTLDLGSFVKVKDVDFMGTPSSDNLFFL